MYKIVSCSVIFLWQESKGVTEGKHVYLENNQWRKGGLLGTGAYSSCFEVIDIKTGRLMAVKQV